MTTYVLQILDGDRAGETIRLSEQRVTIGRKATNTLQLNDEKVSGQHAEIVCEGGRYALRDLGSTNGTMMEGRRVTEVALSGFDTFQIGRVRIVFQEEGAQRPVEDVQVHRLGARGTGVRRRGMLGLVLAVVAAAGLAAWFWTQRSGEGGAVGGRRTKPVAQVAGNMLPSAAAACEQPEPWQLRASGIGFEIGGLAHTGEAALVATGAGGADASGTSVGAHALARLAQPIAVLAGDALQVSAFVRATGGARAALRVRFSSSAAGSDVLWAGSAPMAAEDYAELALETGVPPGTDRVEVEVLALLPSAEAEVLCDDLVLRKGGTGAVLDLRIGGCALSGTTASFALRSGAAPVLLGASPRGDGALAALAAAGLLTFADAGCEVSATVDGAAFRIALGGTVPGATVLRFPRDSVALGVRGRSAGGAFALWPEVFARDGGGEVLLGAGPTRVLVRAADAQHIAGRAVEDTFVLEIEGGAELSLQVDLAASRTGAQAALVHARSLVQEGRPGDALDALTALVDETPHDDRLLAEAERMRADLLLAVGNRIEVLRGELDKAEFFRGAQALRRVHRDLVELVAQYGERHVPQSAAVAALIDRAATQLASREAEVSVRRAADLEALAAMFEETGEDTLRDLVRGYAQRQTGK